MESNLRLANTTQTWRQSQAATGMFYMAVKQDGYRPLLRVSVAYFRIEQKYY
jgi:hypothetical protein